MADIDTKAKRALKWIEDGCPSWGVPFDEIEALAKSVLAAAPVEPVAWHYRAFIGSRWHDWEHINDIEAFRSRHAEHITRGAIELRPLFTTPPAAPTAIEDTLVEQLAEIAQKHLEIDYDGDDAFIRNDSLDSAIRAILASLKATRETA